MKYLMLVCVLFLVGCANAQLGSILNPATREEIRAGKIDTWTAKQSAQLSEGFSKGFPLHERASNRTHWLSEDELAMVKRKIVTLKTIRAGLENNDVSMKKLRGLYDIYEKKSEITLSSIFFIDEAINRAGSSLVNDLHPFWHGEKTAYCGKLGIEVREHYVHDCTTEVIWQELVRRKFYADNPSFESYYNWLFETMQNLKSTKELIFAFGLSQETAKYFAHAKKSGCGDVKGFGTGLAHKITYGHKPEAGYIYRLSLFKVLQSTGNGILLRSMYPDAYKSQPIFVQTGSNYADGTSFRDSGPLVCFTGKVKQYSSVFGANRKVHSFKAIPVNKENYFFLSVGE